MSSRAIALVAAVGAAALLPATAQAGPRMDYEQRYTTAKPGASAGIVTKILYKHPDDPNAKPIPMRKEVFTFPKGMTSNEKVVPDCAASDLELRLVGPSACPRATWIGGARGDTSMSGFGEDETPVTVNAFDYGDGRFRIVAGPTELPMRFVAHARRVGRVTTVNVPRTPGGPPDFESSMRRVDHLFPARSRNGRAYTRTPPRCPKSGVWTFRLEATFADGAVERGVSRMPCRRKSPR